MDEFGGHCSACHTRPDTGSSLCSDCPVQGGSADPRESLGILSLRRAGAGKEGGEPLSARLRVFSPGLIGKKGKKVQPTFYHTGRLLQSNEQRKVLFHFEMKKTQHVALFCNCFRMLIS